MLTRDIARGRLGQAIAALALATANHFVAIGRTARIDVPLTAVQTVQFKGDVSPPAAAVADVVLLTEIRDLLKKS